LKTTSRGRKRISALGAAAIAGFAISVEAAVVSIAAWP
jgi:hypothetical protein